NTSPPEKHRPRFPSCQSEDMLHIFRRVLPIAVHADDTASLPCLLLHVSERSLQRPSLSPVFLMPQDSAAFHLLNPAKYMSAGVSGPIVHHQDRSADSLL